MARAMIFGMVSSALGVVSALAIVAYLANQFPSIDSVWLFGATFLIPWLAFLLGFVPFAKREGKWPIPTRGPRLLAAFLIAFLSGVAAFLCFAVVSFTWNVQSLPPEKQSFIYIVSHPGEVPALRERTVHYDPRRPSTEHNVTWSAPTIMAFVLGGFVGFVWSGRWDKV